MKERQIESKVENIPAVMQFVTAELKTLGCSVQSQTRIKMAIDELFGNICFYAYEGNAGPVTVCVSAEKDPKTVILSFRDRGKPYNPLNAKDPDLKLSGEERPIGGLGIFLVREMMDGMEYEYRDGQNILTLKKVF